MFLLFFFFNSFFIFYNLRDVNEYINKYNFVQSDSQLINIS